MQLNPALIDFWHTPATYKVLKGGRGSSKSWSAAAHAILLAREYTVRILCARQFQNKIDDSVYTLLVDWIHRFGFEDEFDIQKTTIIHNKTGSEFKFKGLWRHINEIKGLEGIDILWLEEAENLLEKQWDTIEPTFIRSNCEFWILFNPQLETDFVYQRFVVNPPESTIVRHINYLENPFLNDKTIGVAERTKSEDLDKYNHIWLGQPKRDDEDAIIQRKWVLAAIDADKELGIDITGERRVGYDVADSGSDANAVCHVHGSVLKGLTQWHAKQDELPKSAETAYDYALSNGASIDYDPIGVGGFVGGYFAILNKNNSTKLKYHKFYASAGVQDKEGRIDPRDPQSPKNGDYFLNAKAQEWWVLRERFMHTYNCVANGADIDTAKVISISSKINYLNELVTELSAPRQDSGAGGKKKVESKDALLKRGVKSTNLADCVIAAMRKRKTTTKSSRFLGIAG